MGEANLLSTTRNIIVIAELVAANNDTTLVQLCEQSASGWQCRVSRSTMGRAVQQLSDAEKKTFERRDGTVNGCSRNGLSFGRYWQAQS